MFGKDTQPFGFIRRNVIRKLACEVNYISQTNEGLIMFFANSRIRVFKISWLDCEQYGKNQYKKQERNQHSTC